MIAQSDTTIPRRKEDVSKYEFDYTAECVKAYDFVKKEVRKRSKG